jgi:hypothetical protein
VFLVIDFWAIARHIENDVSVMAAAAVAVAAASLEA